MWVAVGYESMKIYAKGKTKAECMRVLNTKYPYQYSKKRTKKVMQVDLYPERLKIIKRSR